MKLQLLIATPLLLGIAGSASADDDTVGNAIVDCIDCLSGNGDGECTDECSGAVEDLDDDINECCEWWSCSSCPPTDKATARPKPSSVRSTFGIGSTTTSSAMSSSTSDESLSDGASTDITPVAVVYANADCSGESATLRVMDFVGGKYDSVWDACNAEFDDGKAINYQEKFGTFLRSIVVMDGFTVATSTQCRDDYKGLGDRADTDVQQIINSASGCVSTDYNFNQVDMNPPVATVYQENGCGGKHRKLFVQDFVGGVGQFGGDTAWDACKEQWSDGTDMTYNTVDRTWLESIEVFPGFVVTTATQCNDDYNYDSIQYKSDVVQEDGCVDSTYDFNHIDYAVAGGAIASGTAISTTGPTSTEKPMATTTAQTTTTGRTTTGYWSHHHYVS